MATRQSTIDFILEQIAEAGAVSAKKMFGEYALYCEEKVVALVCDDQLFLKPTNAAKEFMNEYEEGFPYPGAKAYILISGDRWDDAPWLAKLIEISAAELPAPKKKISKGKSSVKKTPKAKGNTKTTPTAGSDIKKTPKAESSVKKTKK
jgi:TfoX/Sxy family transcriptional regulator of competence genes